MGKNRFNPGGLVQQYTFLPIFMQKFEKSTPGSYGLKKRSFAIANAVAGKLCIDSAKQKTTLDGSQLHFSQQYTPC